MNKATISALLTILMWSSLATLTISINHIPSLLSVGLVLVFASIPGLKHWREWQLPRKVWASAVLGMFGYHFLLFDAFSRAPGMSVNMIQYLWPLFIVLGTPLFTQSRLNFGHVLGALLGFSGIILMLSQEPVVFNHADLLGYTEAFIAALLWAFYTLSNRSYKQMPMSAVAGFCLISGILALSSYALTADIQTVIPSSYDFFIIALLGLGPMGLSFYTWDYAIRHGDTRVIGALAYLAPLLSVIWMAIFISEVTLKPIHLVTLLLIIGGASLGQYIEKRKLRKIRLVN
ncbi:EamA/RhaT family transporter [Psychromonas sp. RZ22]|uniref:DMT family transporter n=1 Tax=Psychromonas algarum TaxID=2555643 RepID=UPI001067EE01|nr:EamA family transporter [Psychromonas sp. RZ22]TEW54654.1 EamA/RhaT family transporter [Psychromonas sp. RZ22]